MLPRNRTVRCCSSLAQSACPTSPIVSFRGLGHRVLQVPEALRAPLLIGQPPGVSQHPGVAPCPPGAYLEGLAVASKHPAGQATVQARGDRMPSFDTFDHLGSSSLADLAALVAEKTCWALQPTMPGLWCRMTWVRGRCWVGPSLV